MAYKTCYGSKATTCPVCEGQGKTGGKPCHHCRGNKKVVCPTCQGTGK